MYIVTAAAASAFSGKAKAQFKMSNLPSRKKFKGHIKGVKTRAIDSDASVGDTQGSMAGIHKEMVARRVSLMLPNFLR